MMAHASRAIVDAADIAGLGLAVIAATDGNSGEGIPTIRYINQAALCLCGHTVEELLGSSVVEFVPNLFWPVIEEKWRAFQNGKLERCQFELEVIHREGHAVPVSVGLTPATLLGEPVAIVFLQNITERREALEAVLAAKAEAEELSRVKSVILSNFTHELRTPLHSILGFSALLGETLAEGDQRDYARSIQTSGKRLLTTLTSLMELASLESRPNDLALYPTAISETLAPIAESYRSQMEQRGLVLLLDVGQHIPSIAGQIVLLNEEWFTRAFERIMMNAIKFTHSGTIRVELSEAARPRLHGKPEAWAVIKVRDTGIGMSPEFAARAFDKFKQESTGPARGYEGIGIGLPLARGYVRQMNGEIGLTSEQGKGTEVWMSFPVIAKADRSARKRAHA